MVASVGRITAGRGYDYLTNEVATSKHDYYIGNGEAPGQWTGRGATSLGLASEVAAGDLAVLYGRFVVPSTAGGVRLPSGRWQPEQVLGRAVTLKRGPNGKVSEPLAALDVTFSPSKSVTLLWALSAEEAVRSTVLDAHETAVARALAYLDAHAGHVRVGAGGARRADGQGFVIAQFRHRSARSTAPGERVGDPQLHSHCAILNRVCGADGTWRTLDSKAIYRHAHAAGALYAAELERVLSDRLGVSWIEPTAATPMREIQGIPDRLCRVFSSRRAAVDDTYEHDEAQWRQIHHRSPTRAEAARLRDEATVRSRHRKTGGDVDVHEQWRQMATGDELESIARVPRAAGTAGADGGRLPAGSDALTGRVLGALQEQRAWWTRPHMTTAVARWLADASADSVEAEVQRIVDLCISLEPDTHPGPDRADTSKYTSSTIRDAEERVMRALDDRATFRVDAIRDPDLGIDQAAAVRAMTESSHRVSAVIGPAGAGKTTMLRAVAASAECARRDIIVLCLSAAAARVVTQETGMPANTIAAWRVGNIAMPNAGMVIVDEASMVPTLVLDELVAETRRRSCRLSLVGDYAQMGAPEAGGLLRDIAATPNACELQSIRRFTADWEPEATRRLRVRDRTVAALYDDRGRINPTSMDRAVDDVARTWIDDVRDGHDALIVVDTNRAAADVSRACQQQLLDDRRLGADVIHVLGDGNPVHQGDLIQTRRNTAAIATSDGSRVLNRDVWRVAGPAPGGGLEAVHIQRGTHAVLPSAYLDEHAVLAYATTVAGAQGRTVDRGHIVVTARTSAETLYVGMTRGKHSNTAHVVCDGYDHEELGLGHRSAVDGFAEAVHRDADGSISARSVVQRWSEERPPERMARSADRRHGEAAAWWDKRVRGLPAKLQAVLGDARDEIVVVLSRCSSDTERSHVVANATRRLTRPSDLTATAFVRQLTDDRSSSLSPAAPPNGRADSQTLHR